MTTPINSTVSKAHTNQTVTPKQSGSGGNVVCFKHPSYLGTTSPDLTCKICCSKFVDRIRSEQIAQFKPSTWERHDKFDGSWI